VAIRSLTGGPAHPSRRRFLGLAAPAAIGGGLIFGSGCESLPAAPEKEDWADEGHGWVPINPNDGVEGGLFAKPAGASAPGYRAIVSRLYWQMVWPSRMRGSMPSAWDLLNARRMGAVAEETTLGPKVQSLYGIDGNWCCTLGRAWPGSSGKSAVSRLGIYEISSDDDFGNRIRGFRHGTMSVSLDPGDSDRVEQGPFSLFEPLSAPADGRPFYVCWMLIVRFNGEGAESYT